MHNFELAEKCRAAALNYKTLYVMGCFGAPLTAANKQRYIDHNAYNRASARKKLILAASADTFGFDCVCLIKGILWGWDGDANAIYGGAKYCANGVPDIGADAMFARCKNASADFSKIETGEAVWTSGHIGVYIGGGLAVECTPKWKDGVQITAVQNIAKSGTYKNRLWTKHGKLPWVEYLKAEAEKKPLEQIAREVIAGKWGNGEARKKLLAAAGYSPALVQAKVNALLAEDNGKLLDRIANEVIAGKWGNGAARKKKLAAAGYDPAVVQARVNELLRERNRG